MDFKGILRKHIAPMILAGTMSGSIIGTLPVSVRADEGSSVVAELEEQTSLSGLFDEKEDAKEWILARKQVLEAAYEITGTKIYVYEGCLKNTETILINEIYGSKDYTLSHLEELENNDYYETDIIVDELVQTVETTETVFVNKIFSSLDELNSYKDTLVGKSNLVLDVTKISGSWETVLDEKVCDVSKTSKKELDAYINAIKEEIKISETTNISCDIRVDESTRNELIPTSITKEEFSEIFDSEDEALDFIRLKEKEVENDKDKSYEFSEIIERVGTSIVDNSLINEEFDTIEELNSYIETQYNEGYVLSDIRIIDKSLGSDETEKKYSLTGTKFKEETYRYYELNYELNTQQYENKTVYVASVYRVVKTKNDMYSLTGSYDEIKKEQVTLYNLNGKMFRTISKDRYRAEIRYKELNNEIQTEPEIETTEEEMVEVEASEPSNKSNVLLYSTVLAGATVGLIATKNKIKTKRMTKKEK